MRAPVPSLSRQRGFSLIELVAAFMVFALAFGALMQILSMSIRNTRQSAEYTQAALWAQTKLDIVGVGEKLKEGTSSGKFDDAYRWELDVRKYQVESANASPVQTVQPIDLYHVDLTVSWGSRSGGHSTHFVTLRAANPDLSGGIAAPIPGVVPNGGANPGVKR